MSFVPIPIRDNLVYFIGKQGCTWSCTITLNQYGVDPPVPVDLTEYSIRGQIRKAYSDATSLAEFTCTKVDDLLTITHDERDRKRTMRTQRKQTAIQRVVMARGALLVACAAVGCLLLAESSPAAPPSPPPPTPPTAGRRVRRTGG